MKQRPMSMTIFGILNIGFGMLGLLLIILTMVLATANLPGSNDLVKQMNDDRWARLMMPFDCLAGVALVAAGIGLLLLKNWARVLSMAYAGYSILAGLVGCIVKLAGDNSTLLKIGAVLGTMIVLVYPVLLLIFMLRPNVIAALKPGPPAPPVA